MARTDILKRKDEIFNWIEQGMSKAFIARQLKCKEVTLESYLHKMGLDYKGNTGRKGMSHQEAYVSAFEYLNDNNKHITSYKLKIKLLKEHIKEPICENCGNSHWLGYPIPLELHHKDGNRFNNELSNLSLLCPNCHAFTDNYRSKNAYKS